VLYRFLASYRKRLHDPELKRTFLLWVILFDALPLYRLIEKRFDLPGWLDPTTHLMFQASNLLLIVLLIAVWERLRGVKA